MRTNLTAKEKEKAIALAREVIGPIEKAYTAYEEDFRIIIKGKRYKVYIDENEQFTFKQSIWNT